MYTSKVYNIYKIFTPTYNTKVTKYIGANKYLATK